VESTEPLIQWVPDSFLGG